MESGDDYVRRDASEDCMFRCVSGSLFRVLVATSVIASFAGCENQRFGAREKGALGGAAAGAGLGAIIGSQSGRAGPGTAIGAGIGAIAGGLLGNEIDRQDDMLSDQDRRLDDTDREIEENRRLLAALRRGGADARRTERGIVVNIGDVLFEFDSANLTRRAEGTARAIAAAISKEARGRNISVEGHTDSVGSVGYNQRLSETRARSVAEALAGNGIPRRVMAIRGYGESDPVASNSTESGRRLNRRVEVVIENR